ncbi:hypothetical protein BC831DRAFT_457079 [Entophlyctis helioformis]|nr:hypothetical protein BC831DRAFT_457079 [Entophlyctis helioformis]
MADLLPTPYRFCVGIDFGSTYSGFSYAPVDAPDDINSFTEWENQPANMPFPKAPTSIRYRLEADGTYTPVFWGHKSKRAETRAIKSGELIEITGFKLWFDPTYPRDGQPVGMDWRQPTVDFLRLISDLALNVISHRFGGVAKSEIMWCITVPAIWDESGKAGVRQCATMAGIVNESNQESLNIILEPEAAALYSLKCLNELNRRDKCSFMILDAGGGTVDLTTHIISFKTAAGAEASEGGDRSSIYSLSSPANNGASNNIPDMSSELIEMSRGTGGLCGSTFADRGFKDFFKEQIGHENYRDMRRARPDVFAALMQEWERAKRDFDGVPDDGKAAAPEIISFPAGVLQYVPEDVKERWSNEQGNEEELHIPMERMLAIFHRPVSQCVKLVEEQLQRIGGKCDYLVLVGGFSSSRYLVSQVNHHFRKMVGKIIVPNNPTAAVVQGAVIYGLNPSRIQRRRSRMSYGYQSNVPAADMDNYHPSDLWLNSAGTKFVKVFKCLIAENQEVKGDDEFSSLAYPMNANQEKVQVRLLLTNERLESGKCYSFSLVANIREVGILSAAVPLTLPDRLVRIEYMFGMTEFRAIATIVATGQRKVMSLSGSGSS